MSYPLPPRRSTHRSFKRISEPLLRLRWRQREQGFDGEVYGGRTVTWRGSAQRMEAWQVAAAHVRRRARGQRLGTWGRRPWWLRR
ncbi:hypothetical protein ES332_D01G107300v1 [Gossypium tomentosum]|uniref:Uncharacterized protein n=1 Tax=Gossypium tomentosum TaxID=34277 RepID=A0A5D2M7M1_GOSTO|nr:hypothetical protein ES332_D01G107300v1 [Gossypium tomentosum]